MDKIEIVNPYALKKGCVGITDIGEPPSKEETDSL